MPAGGLLDVGDATGRAAHVRRGRAAASTSPSTSGARRPSPWAVRRSRRPRARAGRRPAHARVRAPSRAGRGARPTGGRRSATTGSSRSPRARTAPRTSSPATTSTTLYATRVRGALQLRPHRRAPDRPKPLWARATAARPGCTRRTSTTPPTPSARSTSPATPRSCSAPTGRASAASSARRPWSAASAGSSASSRPGDTVRFVPVRAEAAASRRELDLPACLPGGDGDDGVLRRLDGEPAGAPTAAAATTTCSSSTAPMSLDLGLRMRVHALHDRAGRGTARRASSTSRPASARCRSTSTPRAAGAAAARRRCTRARGRRCPPTAELVVPSRRVRLPLSLGRPGDPAGHRAVHGRRARRRPVVPVEHRVHPADQRARQRRRRLPDRLRRGLPRARARRRLPRRPGRDAARPAPPPGDDQVQPGPHLDRRELRRHRRRLPVHLRHGGPRRLPVRRPHHAGLEPVPRHGAVRAGAPWLLRFFDRISWYPVTAEELLDLRADLAAGRGSSSTSTTAPSRSPTTSGSWPRTPTRSPRSGSRSRRAFEAERTAWEAAGEFDRAEEAAAVAGRPSRRRRGARRRRARGRAVRGQRLAGRGRRRRRGRGRTDPRGTRGDEDGDATSPRRTAGVVTAIGAAPGRPGRARRRAGRARPARRGGCRMTGRTRLCASMPIEQADRPEIWIGAAEPARRSPPSSSPRSGCRWPACCSR